MLAQKLASRKLWVAILGSLLVFANEKWALGLSPETITGISAMLISFILGEAVVDAQRAKAQVPDVVKAVIDALEVSVVPVEVETDSE